MSAESWHPAPSERIAGVITRIVREPAQQGPPVKTVEVTQHDGSVVAVHCSSTVLREDTTGLLEGDAIEIVYNGLRQSAAGRTYKSYAVKVGEDAGAARSH
jgi:hypothetical protein